MRALIIDDDRGCAEMAADCIEGICDCDTAENIDEAHAHLAHGNYDLILLDLGLPLSPNRLPRVEHGLAMLDHIRATMPTTPVIVVSGEDEKKLPCAAYLQKPYDSRSLKKIVKKVALGG